MTYDDIAQRVLHLLGKRVRHHHLPGERRFRFDLDNSVPPSVATQLAERVGKPARNGDPDPKEPSLVTIPARHGTRFGGTIGTLRFRDDGIDYVAAGGEGAGVGDGPTSRPLPVLILITSASAATARPSNSNSSSLCHRSFLTGYGTASMGAI